MSFLGGLFKSWRQDETTAFFEQTIKNVDVALNDDTLREFKRLVIKYPDAKIDEKFFELLGKGPEAVQARVAIFFFMYLNWGSLNDVSRIFDYVRARNLLAHKDKPVFKDDDDAHLYNFNRTFFKYVYYYMLDIRSIYTLKNGNIEPRRYANLMTSGQINYDGMYFYMRRFRLSHALFENFNWLLNERREHTGFRYVAEVVTRQMVEEYVFVREVFRELFSVYGKVKESKDFARFLVFYEQLIWKDKLMADIFKKFGWFFTETRLALPELLRLSETETKRLDDDLVEHQKEKDDIKYSVNETVSYEDLSKASTQALGLLNEVAVRTDKNPDVFSQKTVLHKLNYENYAKVRIPDEKDEVRD